MLCIAREIDHPAVTFIRGYAEDVNFPAGSVDVVVSSLALHYVEDLDAVFARVRTWLAPSAVLVFSIEHPVITASPDGQTEDGWLLREYFRRGRRDTSWFLDGVVKYHRTVGDVVTALLRAGFRLDALLEPEPVDGAVERQPSLARHLDRPPLLVIRASAR
jgi:SAM-dependent methyltransferase